MVIEEDNNINRQRSQVAISFEYLGEARLLDEVGCRARCSRKYGWKAPDSSWKSLGHTTSKEEKNKSENV